MCCLWDITLLTFWRRGEGLVFFLQPLAIWQVFSAFEHSWESDSCSASIACPSPIQWRYCLDPNACFACAFLAWSVFHCLEEKGTACVITCVLRDSFVLKGSANRICHVTGIYLINLQLLQGRYAEKTSFQGQKMNRVLGIADLFLSSKEGGMPRDAKGFALIVPTVIPCL